MENQQNLPEPVIQVQEPTPQARRPFSFLPFIILFLLIAAVAIISVVLREGNKIVSKLISKNQPTPTVLVLPTIATKTQQSASIATDSGYLKIKEAVQSLKNAVNANPIDDTTLMPPTIDTVIDFAK